MNSSSPSTPTRPTTLLALCLVLWLLALALAGYGLWLFGQPAGGMPAMLALAVALLTAAAGLGLYRLRRWGVVLFAIVGMAGSINHIASAIQRFASLHSAEAGAAIFSVTSVLGAFLIPFALIYLVLVLWRQAQN